MDLSALHWLKLTSGAVIGEICFNNQRKSGGGIGVQATLDDAHVHVHMYNVV